MRAPLSRFFSLFFLVAFALAFGLAPALAQTTADATAASAVLRPGDAVRITVWTRPEMSGEFPISGDGSIAHPYYMSVKVAGVPMSTVNARVQAALAEQQANLKVLVEPLLRVGVGGEVRQPNSYQLTPESTILQAVMQAGGPTERGQLSRVDLVRDGRRRRLDLTRTDAAIMGMTVRSGDQILLPRTTLVFREVVVPALSILGSIASIVNITRYYR